MKPSFPGILTLAFVLLVAWPGHVSAQLAGKADPARAVGLPAGVDHRGWDRLLRGYVDERGLVAYAAWRANAADLAALDRYLAQYDRPAAANLPTNERAAGLANAYNAFAIRQVLAAYPVESLLATRKPLTGQNWRVGGKMVSLNDLENSSLRPLVGWRTHSVLVCAARSCPPLQREAFTAANFTAQSERAYRVWLARENLNRFEPAARRVELSKVFKWFRADFETAGGVPKVIAPFVPPADRAFVAGGDYETKHLRYDFGLNDQGPRGRNYGTGALLGDVLGNLF